MWVKPADPNLDPATRFNANSNADPDLNPDPQHRLKKLAFSLFLALRFLAATPLALAELDYVE